MTQQKYLRILAITGLVLVVIVSIYLYLNRSFTVKIDLTSDSTIEVLSSFNNESFLNESGSKNYETKLKKGDYYVVAKTANNKETIKYFRVPDETSLSLDFKKLKSIKKLSFVSGNKSYIYKGKLLSISQETIELHSVNPTAQDFGAQVSAGNSSIASIEQLSNEEIIIIKKGETHVDDDFGGENYVDEIVGFSILGNTKRDIDVPSRLREGRIITSDKLGSTKFLLSSTDGLYLYKNSASSPIKILSDAKYFGYRMSFNDDYVFMYRALDRDSHDDEDNAVKSVNSLLFDIKAKTVKEFGDTLYSSASWSSKENFLLASGEQGIVKIKIDGSIEPIVKAWVENIWWQNDRTILEIGSDLYEFNSDSNTLYKYFSSNTGIVHSNKNISPLNGAAINKTLNKKYIFKLSL